MMQIKNTQQEQINRATNRAIIQSSERIHTNPNLSQINRRITILKRGRTTIRKENSSIISNPHQYFDANQEHEEDEDQLNTTKRINPIMTFLREMLLQMSITILSLVIILVSCSEFFEEATSKGKSRHKKKSGMQHQIDDVFQKCWN